MTEPTVNYNRNLTEHVRKVHKLLSLYVLALQEDTALIANDHRGLAQALRDVTEAIEQEATRAHGQLPGNPNKENHP